MLDARRSFVQNLAGAAGAFLLFQSQPPIPEPRPRTPVYPPEPAEKQDDTKSDSISPKVNLRLQEKELRETVDQLFIRVRDLKAQLDQLPTTQIFSVTTFKQTQEIEKLAKRLKSYARG